MHLFDYFKKRPKQAKANEGKESYELKMLNLECDAYRKYDISPLLEWIAKETDPILLASAYCLLNTWDWPSFWQEVFPAPEDKNILDTPAYALTYPLMDMCRKKAEALSPGLTQAVWMTSYYQRYSARDTQPTTSA
jgi:hypothetical protein